MKPFMDETFLLDNDTAYTLYHRYARDVPIFDYHCHLNPDDIAENKAYQNITELWLEGDHYKWRAMRWNGVEEQYITGDADDYDKFLKWAETLENCIGNPLYHWSHLELKRYFNIDEPLCKQNAAEVWETCNRQIRSPEFTAQNIIKRSNVRVICTTDDPLDQLEAHRRLKADRAFSVTVLPTFRPDRILQIDRKGWKEYVVQLETTCNCTITSFDDLVACLTARIDYFHKLGARISDHSLEPVVYEESSKRELGHIVNRALAGKNLTKKEVRQYQTALLIALGRQYAEKGWVMQFHIGALRDTNTRLYRAVGGNAGCDSMGDDNIARPLARLLDALDRTDHLPKTILYALHPKDCDTLATVAGNFQGGGVPGKVQLGAAWWFNDQKEGICRQLTTLANQGVLSTFVGMLTDSRSLLSYTRHEYFRRILCNVIGTWVENGEYPRDVEKLGEIVRNVSYDNAVAYFDL